MQLGAVTYNVLKDMDLETVIQTLEKTGFDGVELRTTHKHGVEPSLSEEERQKVKACPSRAVPSSSSPSPTTAACTRCSDSVSSPRVTTTSSSNVLMNHRNGLQLRSRLIRLTSLRTA